MRFCYNSRDEFISESDQIRSVLDYYINITALAKRDQYYVALTGKRMNNFLVMIFVTSIVKIIYFYLYGNR